jgi:phage shock protein A
MALINRISRLFKADFNAVLDRIEEPEQLLRQAIRDMEDELVAADQRVRARAHEQELLGYREAELEEKLNRIEEELDLCFGSKKHGLARSLVKKKLEGQRLLTRLASRISTNEKDMNRANEQLEADRSSLEGLKQKAELFAQRDPGECGGQGDDISWLKNELVVSDDEIEVAFLREQQARSAS